MPYAVKYFTLRFFALDTMLRVSITHRFYWVENVLFIGQIPWYAVFRTDDKEGSFNGK